MRRYYWRTAGGECSPPERALARGGGGGVGFARTARQACSGLFLPDAACGRDFKCGLVRAARGVRASSERRLDARDELGGAPEDEIPALGALDVERIPATDLRGQGSGGVSPESGFKIAVSHGCNGGARSVKEQTMVSHLKDKKNS